MRIILGARSSKGTIEGIDPLPLKLSAEGGGEFVPAYAGIFVTLVDGRSFEGDTNRIGYDDRRGMIFYDWTPDEVGTLSDVLPRFNCHAEWRIESEAGDRIERHSWFTVSRYRIQTGISADDLTTDPLLERFRTSQVGEVSQAAPLWIRDEKNLIQPSGHWRRARIEIGSTVATVAEYDGVTQTLYLERALPEPAKRFDSYTMQRSYASEVDAAFDELLLTLEDRIGRDRLARIVDPAQLRRAHVYLSKAHAFALLPAGEEVKVMESHYRERFGAELDRIALLHEDPRHEADGRIDESEDRQAGSVRQFWGIS